MKNIAIRQPFAALALGALLLLALAGCASQPSRPLAGAASADGTPAAASSALASYRHPASGLYTGGQPSAGEWEALAAAGVTTVINLRTAGELEGRDEAAEVVAQGMRYLEIPVGGPDDVTEANAGRLWHAIRAADGPVLVHCASGNRVGALLALGAYRNDGQSAREALDFGQAAGLTRLEPVIRKRLDCRPPAEKALVAAETASADSAAASATAISCVGN